MFKDGYSLIIKRGVATTDKGGELFTDDVPDAAVLGSFWAVPEEGRSISMLAGWKSTKASDDKPMTCTQAQANCRYSVIAPFQPSGICTAHLRFCHVFGLLCNEIRTRGEGLESASD